MTTGRDESTVELLAAAGGSADAAARLLPRVYAELRALAGHYFRGERPGHTLQPTALVHEAYLRLLHVDRIDWQGRTHFFAMAAKEMRRVLVDHARRRDAEKRGGELGRVTLSDAAAVGENRTIDVIALDQAIETVARTHPRRARVAELRIFAGLEVAEIPALLAVSERTVKEDWRMARALIGRALGGSASA